MQLAAILYSQGFGDRRECAARVAAGQVQTAGRVVDDPQADIDTDGLVLHIEGRDWPFHARALLMLNKPAGYECSRVPRQHPGVLELLPPPLRRRGVQPVGRLDADTTGLLLLTDDGALIHRLTSPKHNVPKVYEVLARHPPSDEQIERLRQGVVLVDDPRPTRVAGCERIDDLRLRLVLAEGRYHQVKRMLGAVGNRCDALHRSAFGALTLPPGLASGQWCWLDIDVAI